MKPDAVLDGPAFRLQRWIAPSNPVCRKAQFRIAAHLFVVRT
jgi:hypothetical protein